MLSSKMFSVNVMYAALDVFHSAFEENVFNLSFYQGMYKARKQTQLNVSKRSCALLMCIFNMMFELQIHVI